MNSQRLNVVRIVLLIENPVLLRLGYACSITDDTYDIIRVISPESYILPGYIHFTFI
jgi:hypothetical protein